MVEEDTVCFVNKSLLVQSYAHSLLCHLWLLSRDIARAEWLWWKLSEVNIGKGTAWVWPNMFSRLDPGRQSSKVLPVSHRHRNKHSWLALMAVLMPPCSWRTVASVHLNVYVTCICMTWLQDNSAWKSECTMTFLRPRNISLLNGSQYGFESLIARTSSETLLLMAVGICQALGEENTGLGMPFEFLKSYFLST